VIRGEKCFCACRAMLLKSCESKSGSDPRFFNQSTLCGQLNSVGSSKAQDKALALKALRLQE
jgi:hypothetical protein